MSLPAFSQARGTSRWAKRSGGLEDTINGIISAVNGLVLSGITADTFFSANVVSSANNIDLGVGDSNLQFITLTTSGKKLILPNTNTVLFDGFIMWVKNEGSETFDIVADDGTTVVYAAMAAGSRVALLLKSNATANGVWDVVLLSASSANEYSADGGVADAYEATLSPAPTSYFAGMRVMIKIANTNTGACTLDVNSLGAQDIKVNVDQDPVAGALQADEVVEFIYDGTNFQKTSSSITMSDVEENSLIYAIMMG